MTYTYSYPLIQTVPTVDFVNNNCVNVNNIVFYGLLTSYSQFIIARRVWNLVRRYVADKICSPEIQKFPCLPYKYLSLLSLLGNNRFLYGYVLSC